MSFEEAEEPYSRYRDWKGWRADAFGALDVKTRRYFDVEFELCGLDDLSGASILEIGFGNGEFAVWSSGRGAGYRGTEQIAALVRTGRERGFDVHEASSPLDSLAPAGSVDVVVAFDVFEHLRREELREMWMSIRALLAPGGSLVGRVPSGDSPFARAIQYGDLTHETVLSTSSIEQLAGEAGFEVAQIRAPAFPMLGIGLRALIRRLAVVLVRSVVYPITTHALMGGGKLVLTPDLIFVLRRPTESATAGESD